MGDSLAVINQEGLTEEEKVELAKIFDEELASNMDGVEARMPRVELVKTGHILMPADTEHQDDWSAKDIVVTIVHKQAVRSYYSPKRSEDDENKEPDCASTDGKTPNGGFDRQSDSCSGCPMDEWGSALSSSGEEMKGKACREKRRLFIVPEGGAIPYILHVPTTSIKEFDAFVTNLTAARIPLIAVKAKIKANKTTRGQMAWCVLEFEREGLHDAKMLLELRNLKDKVIDQVEVENSSEIPF